MYCLTYDTCPPQSKNSNLDYPVLSLEDIALALDTEQKFKEIVQLIALNEDKKRV